MIRYKCVCMPFLESVLNIGWLLELNEGSLIVLSLSLGETLRYIWGPIWDTRERGETTKVCGITQHWGTFGGKHPSVKLDGLWVNTLRTCQTQCRRERLWGLRWSYGPSPRGGSWQAKAVFYWLTVEKQPRLWWPKDKPQKICRQILLSPRSETVIWTSGAASWTSDYEWLWKLVQDKQLK